MKKWTVFSRSVICALSVLIVLCLTPSQSFAQSMSHGPNDGSVIADGSLAAVPAIAPSPAPADGTASGAVEQTTPPVNPSTLQFGKSPDHDVIQFGGAVVTSYGVEFYLGAATQPVQTVSAGKPTPAADGTITVDLKLLSRPVTVAGTYTLKVVAIGPGGSASTPASDPFSLGPVAPAAPAGKPVIK